MNRNEPLVSVVIPAFNAARTIAGTIASALEQTVTDVEVIVVDDGSTDRTVDTARSVPDDRLSVIEQANRGAAAARNAGIARSRGTWLAFLDADDVWAPNKLARQLELIAERPGTLAAQAGCYYVNDELEPFRIGHCRPTDDLLLSFLDFRNLPAAMSSWIVKRSLVEEIGAFNTELAILEDWEFSIRLARFANPLLIDEPLTMYRIHPGNRSRDLDLHIRPGLIVLGDLFADPALPKRVVDRKRRVYARFYLMLCGGAFNVRRPCAVLKWGLRAAVCDPRVMPYAAAMPARYAMRKLDARRSGL